MPAVLIRRILLCVGISTPAIVIRLMGMALPAVLEVVLFGAAVVSAAFLLAWAAEAAQKDISGTLAIALLALIAVLPEFAVDLYYAFQAGSDAAYAPYAAANMTGSSRLILAFGWSLVAVVAIVTARRQSRNTPGSRPTAVALPVEGTRTISFLALLGILGLVIALLGQVPVWLGIVLVAMFAIFLWRSGGPSEDEPDEFVGSAALIADLAQRPRRVTVVALFLVSAAIILLSAEPFAEALVASGSALGMDSFYLVQWLAPLASEAPEFIIAIMFALRGNGAAAIGTLMASNANQWSLLVGSLPIAHLLGGGPAALVLDARQVSEFVLTASLTLFGVAIVLGLRFPWWAAVVLAVLFVGQFVFTSITGRYVLSSIQLALAVLITFVQRRHLLPTLTAAFRREPTVVEEHALTTAGQRH